MANKFSQSLGPSLQEGSTVMRTHVFPSLLSPRQTVTFHLFIHLFIHSFIYPSANPE